MVTDDYDYGNEGHRKAQEQFPEGLWEWNYGTFAIMILIRS